MIKRMNKIQPLNFLQYKKGVLAKDPQLKAEYDKLQPEFALVEADLAKFQPQAAKGFRKSDLGTQTDYLTCAKRSVNISTITPPALAC
jgi:hypothetical protein